MQEAAGFIVVGLIVAGIGGALVGWAAASDSGVGVFVGVAIMAAGGVMTQVGTIAAGVILGLRESRS